MHQNYFTMTSRRVRITNEVLNSYGTRLITAGGDIADFKSNPVLLYMHERGNVIGTIENIAVEGDAVVGDLCFDEVGELSKRVAKQWEKGSLRMVSAGIKIVETSSDPSLLVQGQTCPTITKWKLREVSVVDIGANPDSIRLFDKDGELITLAEGGENSLPRLNNNQQQIKQMDQTQFALSLGLPATATDEQIQEKISQLKASEQSALELKQRNDQITLAAITSAVDAAVKEKRFTADKKEHFIKLGQQIGLEELNSTIAAMQPAQKLASFVAPTGEQAWKKLSDVPSDQLMNLRENDVKLYRTLYEAEYGYQCSF